VAISLLTRMVQFYLHDSIGMSTEEAALAVLIAGGLILVTNGLAAYPSGVLSDRFGRKAMIYAACAISLVGMLPLIVAQRDPAIVIGTIQGANGPVQAMFPLLGLAVILAGAGFGTFYAVDWALITDIIPKETTGRYMGISNVVTAMAGPLALFIGGLTAGLFNEVSFGLGPRMAFLLAALFYVIAAILLRPVDQRRWEDVHGGTPSPVPAPADAAAPA
jgi:MFS family permease